MTKASPTPIVFFVLALGVLLSGCPGSTRVTDAPPPVGANSSPQPDTVDPRPSPSEETPVAEWAWLSFTLHTDVLKHLASGKVTGISLNVTPGDCESGITGNILQRVEKLSSAANLATVKVKKGCSYTVKAALGVISSDQSQLGKVYFSNSDSLSQVTLAASKEDFLSTKLELTMTEDGKRDLVQASVTPTPSPSPSPTVIPQNPDIVPLPTPDIVPLPSPDTNPTPTPTPQTPTGPGPILTGQKVELDKVTFTLPDEFKPEQVGQDGQVSLVTMARESKQAFFYSRPTGFDMKSTVSKRAKISLSGQSYSACGQSWSLMGTEFKPARGSRVFTALFLSDIGGRAIFGYVRGNSMDQAVSDVKLILDSCKAH